MFRRSPLLGAAAIYGVSRAGARRGMQVEVERQQAMEYEFQRRQAAQEAQRREEERRREEEDKRQEKELQREKERIKMEVELEEREKARAKAEQQYGQQPGGGLPAYGGVDVLFCSKCGNQCKVGDKFCSGCGIQLPPIKQM
ncbi:uncharacterized protein Z519_07911 [Cladophialophora bantiana CBS 173.52]|uniref:Zinc-ribbon domain-containing protein n=1 Tax=Cladophialophora bantiana (strain ATCC 10958 / CBS 173.52 / CDC B-1940 / NIH 8579) TaxID=1442370 RepID=A0A0D2FX17_CLAB1|nr:uncharacterized protein Z519_07911 [Cladophialophora bantiana CBS 173.52]KIW91017.1 hypothetical protein Z519_07911 [Cladophialophora bantiana CBS 173.52]